MLCSTPTRLFAASRLMIQELITAQYKKVS